MIYPGAIVTCQQGTRLQIGEPMTNLHGGQAALHHARNLDTNDALVLKCFTETSADLATRLRFLCSEAPSLRQTCPAVCPPTDVFIHGAVMAHVTPLVSGTSLNQHLGQPGLSFISQMRLAIALAHVVAVIHARHWVHGDIHLENFLVCDTPQGIVIYAIDLDNFWAPGLPPPPCVGHPLYMAPELRRPHSQHQRAMPTEDSDCFALAALLHEVLTLRHVAHPRMRTLEETEATMLQGSWLSDPACGTYSWQAGEGFPPGIFDYQLTKMIRSGLSLEPRNRTRADRWRTVLAEALMGRRLFTHDPCGGTVFVESSRIRCPYCLQDYPLAKLVFPQLHKAILIDSAAVPIGRKDLLSPRVSARHAVARRFGPLVQLESYGSNGTYRRDQGGWIRLPDQQAVIVEPGDRLRFADVECRIETA